MLQQFEQCDVVPVRVDPGFDLRQPLADGVGNFSVPSSTSMPMSVPVIALVHDPRCTLSSVVRGLFGSSATSHALCHAARDVAVSDHGDHHPGAQSVVHGIGHLLSHTLGQ